MSAYHDLLAGHRFCEEAAEPGAFPGTRLSLLQERGLRVPWKKREENQLEGNHHHGVPPVSPVPHPSAPLPDSHIVPPCPFLIFSFKTISSGFS